MTTTPLLTEIYRNYVKYAKAKLKADKNPMMWTGMDAWLAVMCYNTIEGGKKNMPKPTSWADLANPVYKDSVVMPNPASSGTGYQAVYAWLQIMGEKAGWETATLTAQLVNAKFPDFNAIIPKTVATTVVFSRFIVFLLSALVLSRWSA